MASSDDFGFHARNFTSSEVLEFLDRRIGAILEEVEQSPVWDAVVGPHSQGLFMAEVLKEIYLEIVMYQPDAIEGAINAIAQFPRTMPVAWFEEMLHHQAEEFDHGEMALRDYVALGGDEATARQRRQSPSAFAVSAIWRNIAEKRDPFAYLGAVYLFEGLTPIITGRVKDRVRARLGGIRGLEFVVHHATADLEHTREIRQLITDVLSQFPEKAESLVYGFEYFAHVYPLPGWIAALRRAERRSDTARLAAE